MSTPLTQDIMIADLSLNTAPDVPVAGLVLLVQKNRKQVEKTRQETERKASKQKRDVDKSSGINIPIVCHPRKHPLYNPSLNTVSRSVVQYIHNLQQNDITARPTKWSLVLLNSSVRRKNNLILSYWKKNKELAQHQMWHCPSLNHYYMASISLQFKAQLDSGLSLPVLILSEKELGILISTQSIWSGQSFESLIDKILKHKNASIEGQDQSISSLEQITKTKTCELVRARFELALEDQGCPWNYLEVQDCLPGFKSP